MDQAARERWWDLHVRFARGQALSTQEVALYEAGRQLLEQDEQLKELESTRTAREHLMALEADRRQMEPRRQQLESEIAVLEKRLQQQARQLLGVEE